MRASKVAVRSRENDDTTFPESKARRNSSNYNGAVSEKWVFYLHTADGHLE